MSAASKYLEQELLNHVLRNVAFTSPTTVYVGIVNDTATDADLESGDLANEITGYDGDRPTATFSAPTDETTGSEVANDVEISFQNMPEVTVGNLIITDSATKGSGNVLYHSSPTAIKTANAGDTYRILVGDLTVNLD